jgi:hypothetical protein
MKQRPALPVRVMAGTTQGRLLMAEKVTRGKYVRRSKAEKLSAVLAAEMSGQQVTAERTGIPLSTLHGWMDQPEFAEFRTKTREELQETVRLVAHLAWSKVAEGIQKGEFEPRDILFAAEKSASLMQLLNGQATERTEVVSVTDGMDDHEKETLGKLLRDEMAKREVGV